MFRNCSEGDMIATVAKDPIIAEVARAAYPIVATVDIWIRGRIIRASMPQKAANNPLFKIEFVW